MTNYLKFLGSTFKTQQALVDYYTGKIGGPQLHIKLLKYAIEFQIEELESFSEFLLSDDIDELKYDRLHAPLPASSSSLVFRLFDLDTETVSDEHKLLANHYHTALLRSI